MYLCCALLSFLAFCILIKNIYWYICIPGICYFLLSFVFRFRFLFVCVQVDLHTLCCSLQNHFFFVCFFLPILYLSVLPVS